MSTDPYRAAVNKELARFRVSIKTTSMSLTSERDTTFDGNVTSRDELIFKRETAEFSIAISGVLDKVKQQRVRELEEMALMMSEGTFKPLCLDCSFLIPIEMFEAHPARRCVPCRQKRS